MTALTHFTPHNRRPQQAAVARVCADELRRIEQALGPNATAEERATAREQVRDLVDLAEWRTVKLPPERREAA